MVGWLLFGLAIVRRWFVRRRLQSKVSKQAISQPSVDVVVAVVSVFSVVGLLVGRCRTTNTVASLNQAVKLLIKTGAVVLPLCGLPVG